MTKILFTGHVYPRRAQLDHPITHRLKWDISPGREATLDIEIMWGKIRVDCDIDGVVDHETMSSLYIRTLESSKMVVDMITFATGIGFAVSIDRYISPTGHYAEPGGMDGNVAALCSAFSLMDPESFKRVFGIVASDPGIFMALNDLAQAVSVPHVAPVNCARAVEGLRHLIAPGRDAKKGWMILNSALRCEKTYTDLITLNSFEQRHGNRIPISGAVIRKITQRSWTLMNRFLEYKKRGGIIPLPQPEFPTLI